MMIETNCTVACFGDLLGEIQGLDAQYDGTSELFKAHLKEEMAGDAGATARLDAKEDAEDNDEIAAIKETGLVAFIMEQREKRIREEILASMGLTEEALAKMPPEQRALIEKLISEETQKRLTAEALMQNGDDKKSGITQLEEIGVGSGTILKNRKS